MATWPISPLISHNYDLQTSISNKATFFQIILSWLCAEMASSCSEVSYWPIHVWYMPLYSTHFLSWHSDSFLSNNYLPSSSLHWSSVTFIDHHLLSLIFVHLNISLHLPPVAFIYLLNPFDSSISTCIDSLSSPFISPRFTFIFHPPSSTSISLHLHPASTFIFTIRISPPFTRISLYFYLSSTFIYLH